jgi:hypothetical protein
METTLVKINASDYGLEESKAKEIESLFLRKVSCLGILVLFSCSDGFPKKGKKGTKQVVKKLKGRKGKRNPCKEKVPLPQTRLLPDPSSVILQVCLIDSVKLKHSENLIGSKKYYYH